MTTETTETGDFGSCKNVFNSTIWYNPRAYFPMKVTVMLVGKFKLNPQGRPMKVWLKLKLTPDVDFCVVSVRAFFVTFFIRSPKRYLNWQI